MRLTKHHGLGNDFLVHLTDEPMPIAGPKRWSEIVAPEPWRGLATWLCDRRRGVGADGLIVASWVGGDDVEATMLLVNADGSRAEMSGNGIRCLAQAIARTRGESEAKYRIATDGGVRTVTVGPTPMTSRSMSTPRWPRHSDVVTASVDMGPVTDIDAPVGWAAVGTDEHRPVAHLSLGNPHTVVGVEDLAEVDLAAIGAQVPDVNLEIIIAGPSHDQIIMRVHERGAGITEACGTGACAAAVAAARWGLAAPKNGEIVVSMDGGSARVRLSDDDVTLIGPATFVASIEVPE